MHPSGHPSTTDGTPSTHRLADGSALLVGAPTTSHPMAIVAGRLVLIGGNCVGLVSPGGGQTTVVVFPHGTHPSGDGRAIVLPDGVEVTMGHCIWGGGGYTTRSQSPDALAPWPDAPSGCVQATTLASIYDVRIGQGPTGVCAPMTSE